MNAPEWVTSGESATVLSTLRKGELKSEYFFDRGFVV